MQVNVTYRLTPAEVRDAVIAILKTKGRTLPSDAKDIAVDIEKGFVVVQVKEPEPQGERMSPKL